MWIFEITFRSRVYGANVLGLTVSRFRAVSGPNETQQLREGQLVGRMLLQRLATGATAVKYRRGPIYTGQRGTLRACAV